MSTLAFTFGVVCTIAAIFVAVLVWTIVKVVKQEKQINDNRRYYDDSISNLWRRRDEDDKWRSDNEREFHRAVDKRFEDLERHIDHRFQSMDTNTDGEVQNLYRAINDQITDAVTQSKSYTDSRIDKMIEGNKPKQVIKNNL